jgi:DNA polymerase III epsilon subunit-like protein
MDFVAIDFEKANDDSASGCQIGLARVRNGVIVETFESILRPHEAHQRLGAWQLGNLSLTPNDLISAPTIAEVLNEIVSFIGQDYLVAHQASTDLNIFKKSLESWGLNMPEFRVICSLNFSRAVIPERPHGLASLCERLGIPLTNHHDAIDDALACANLMIHLIQKDMDSNLDSLHSRFGYSLKQKKLSNEFYNSKLSVGRDIFYSNLNDIHEFFKQSPSELEFDKFPLAGQSVSTIRGFFDLDINKLSEWVEAVGGHLVDFDIDKPSDLVLQGNKPSVNDQEKKLQTLAIVKLGKSAINEEKFAKLIVESLADN